MYVRSSSQEITVMTTDENGKLNREGIAQLQATDGIYEDRYYFNRLLVQSPEHRRKGLGSELVRIVLNEAQKHNRGIWCDPNPYDGPKMLKPLIRFYLRHGFTKVKAKNGGTYLIWNPK